MTSTGWRTGVLVFVALAGCSSVGVDPADGCTYEGTVHPTGTTFPAIDGCNSCFCSADGLVNCTLAVCLADGGVSCFYGGQLYDVGDSFPSTDGCNSCSCSPAGAVTCTERACAAPCTLDATYTFGLTGGLVAYVDIATLTPPALYTYVRSPGGSRLVAPALRSCSPALPACLTDGAIDVADIIADLAQADVQQSFAAVTPPIYGVDSRPVDGSIFEVDRATGGSFLVGGDCPPTSSSCRPIPAGVAKLVADLRALNDQQLADPACSTLRN
jgi:hypothetical protein